MKKILYISSRVFWPPVDGHKVEMYHYCRGLHEKYGYDIDVYAFDNRDSLTEPPEFINKVELALNIGQLEKIKNIVFKSFFSSLKWPLQCSLYFSKNNVNKISSIITENNYDVVIVDMIRLAPYYSAFENLSCKKILDIDDMLSKRYSRQLNSLSLKTNIAGNYHHKLPGLIQRVLKSKAIKRFVLKTEIPRMKKAEKYYSELYDKVIFVSEIETEEFNKNNNSDKAVTVSLGVDFKYYSENLNVKKKPNTAVFIGNFVTPANADSVRMIAKDILPLCKNVKSFICIGNCPDELVEEFKNNEKIQFTGKVDDLRPYVEEGIVFLAPLAYGTGIKTKILEAMAMGLPVVTNSIGAEGIWVENGKHWIVSDDPEEIANSVDELMNSQAECDEMGQNAKKFIEENFQWDIIFEQFKKLGL